MDELGQLRVFYENTSMREIVKKFILHNLDTHALENLHKGVDATALPLAIKGVEKAFEELEANFKPRKERKVTNRAR